MHDLLPERTQVSPVSTDFRTQGDFQILLNLFNKGPYQIPHQLRTKVLQSIDRALDEPDIGLQLIAGRLLEKLDSINVKLAQTAMPKKHEHFNPTEFTDKDLLDMIVKAKHLLPGLKE